MSDRGTGARPKQKLEQGSSDIWVVKQQLAAAEEMSHNNPGFVLKSFRSLEQMYVRANILEKEASSSVSSESVGKEGAAKLQPGNKRKPQINRPFAARDVWVCGGCQKDYVKRAALEKHVVRCDKVMIKQLHF